MAAAMSKSHRVAVVLLLTISLFHSHASAVDTRRRSRASNHNHFHRRRRAEKLLRPPVPSSCASPPLPQGALTIYHTNGPCSPFRPNTGNTPSSPNDVVAKKFAVDSSDHGKGISVPTFGRDLGAGNYVVTVGLGTPKQDLHLMLDTGSDVSWVECRPGKNKNGNRFDPKSSSTFSADLTCDRPGCNYTVKYLDGSKSVGYYVKDKLTVSTDEFPGFVFGCSQRKTRGFGKTAGILALGQSGVVSFTNQTAGAYSGNFCYCLPTKKASSGYLLFGKGATQHCRSTNKPSSTPLVGNPSSPNQYSVDLNGITIGGARVSFSSSSSSSSSVIDSGTVITQLPAAVFEQVRAEFVKSMAGYAPVAAPGEVSGTCYDLQGKFRDAVVPAVVLHFEGGLDVRLGSSAVVWREEGDAKVCLAFAAKVREDGPTIIGNHQQRGLNVLYNVEHKRVEIGAGSCGD